MVILYEGFDSVEITAKEPVKAYLSQKNWDSNLGNSFFLASFVTIFLFYKYIHTNEVCNGP